MEVFVKAVIGYAALREVVSPYFFRAVPGADLRLSGVVNFFIALFLLYLIEFCP